MLSHVIPRLKPKFREEDDVALRTSSMAKSELTGMPFPHRNRIRRSLASIGEAATAPPSRERGGGGTSQRRDPPPRVDQLDKACLDVWGQNFVLQ